jgi:hypothetical protein
MPKLPQPENREAIVIGTGPGLLPVADLVREQKGKRLLFGINNTHQDFPLDVWIACDPAWHSHYGKVEGDFDKWHWDEAICNQHGYRHIPGKWLDGLSTDPSCISYGHSSGWQAINLAVHYGVSRILLVGFDMTYRKDEPRHYFDGLSDEGGEYPEPLRKASKFDKGMNDGLLWDYRHIAKQCERGEIPSIINCTPGSAMKWFPIRHLSDFA